MIHDIREAFYECLADLDWMDGVTKHVAMDKVNVVFSFHFCYTTEYVGNFRFHDWIDLLL